MGCPTLLVKSLPCISPAEAAETEATVKAVAVEVIRLLISDLYVCFPASRPPDSAG